MDLATHEIKNRLDCETNPAMNKSLSEESCCPFIAVRGIEVSVAFGGTARNG